MPYIFSGMCAGRRACSITNVTTVCTVAPTDCDHSVTVVYLVTLGRTWPNMKRAAEVPFIQIPRLISFESTYAGDELVHM